MLLYQNPMSVESALAMLTDDLKDLLSKENKTGMIDHIVFIKTVLRNQISRTYRRWRSAATRGISCIFPTWSLACETDFIEKKRS